LNAASSITYPTAFTGDERRVEITGEAYFEVFKNVSKRFKVKINKGVEVEVLGTHFNINAYKDEVSVKTTLLEGAVKISNGNSNEILKPGQQAQIAADPSASPGTSGQGQIKIVNDADIEKVMAWKQNRFVFSGDDIGAVMRQISRWYDVDVSYEGTIPDRHFSGIVNRNNNVSTVLSMLEFTDKIRFRIEGNKIIVMP
jgi:ferric-dicitrate binding protein FerR (iron transport regulator)